MNEEIKLYECRTYLFCNYELSDKNSNQIAKECNVSGTTILKWLRKFNIRIRTKSEITTGKNNPNYNKHWSEVSKDKMRGKNNPMYRKIGKNHPKFKGDKVGVKGLHLWIAKHKPKPADGKCKICHKIKDNKGITKLELSNIKDHQYKRNIDDFQYAHHSCQIIYDAKKRKKKTKKEKR